MLDRYTQELIRRAAGMVTVQKAGETLTTDVTSGIMVAQQVRRFFRRLVARSTILSRARTVLMDSPTYEVDKVLLGEFLQVPGGEITPVTATKPTFSKTTLTAVELVGAIRISVATLEDNLEKEGFADTLVELMAEEASLDFARVGIQGDTTAGGLLSRLDGVLKQMNGGNILNAGNNAIDAGIFADALKTMPDAHKDRPGLAFFVAPNQEIAYREAYAARQTSGGDAVLNSKVAVTPFGYELAPEVAVTATQGLLINPSNILVGLHRQVTIKTDEDIEGRFWKIVLSLRADVKIEDADGVVRIDSLAQAA